MTRQKFSLKGLEKNKSWDINIYINYYFAYFGGLEEVWVLLFISLLDGHYNYIMNSNITEQTGRADKPNLLEGEAYSGVDLHGAPHPLMLYAETRT